MKERKVRKALEKIKLRTLNEKDTQLKEVLNIDTSH